jgi:hypothetical protein
MNEGRMRWISRASSAEAAAEGRVDEQRRHRRCRSARRRRRNRPGRPAGAAIAVFSSFADVTRWKMSCCGIEPMASVRKAVTKEPLLGPRLWKELELAGLGGRGDHLGRPAGHVAHQPGDARHADDDHHRLEQVGQRHRPHAAPDACRRAPPRAEDDAGLQRDRAVGKNGEGEAEGGELRRGPAE